MDAIHYHVRSEGQIVKRLSILPSAWIWAAGKTFWACGPAKMRVPSSGGLYCIIHQLRNCKYVSYKDLKALMADLKAVYAAVDKPSALESLNVFSERWDPKISQSWRENRANLSTYFKYPQEVRRRSASRPVWPKKACRLFWSI